MNQGSMPFGDTDVTVEAGYPVATDGMYEFLHLSGALYDMNASGARTGAVPAMRRFDVQRSYRFLATTASLFGLATCPVLADGFKAPTLAPNGSAQAPIIPFPGAQRTLPVVFADRLDVKNYGAFGDNTSHPLSATYASLTLAKFRFPHATNLTEETDYAATVEAVDTACGNSTKAFGTEIVFPYGGYFFNQTLAVSCDYVVLHGERLNTAFINRVGDYGPTFKFAKATGYLNQVGATDLVFSADSSMTVAGSAAH